MSVPPHISRPPGSHPTAEDIPANGKVDASRARLDKATFFAIMAAFPTGVTVVTTLDEDGHPRGLTSNALCSVSAEPPLLLVCIDRRSTTLTEMQRQKRFVVNFLGAGTGDLANRFASKDPDRFAGVPWRLAANGMPWLHEAAIAYAECTIEQAVVAGDHVVLIAAVTGGEPAPGNTSPLMYFRRSYAAWPTP